MTSAFHSFRPRLGSGLLLPLVLTLAACATPQAGAVTPADPTEPTTPPPSVALEEVATGFAEPTTVTSAGDGTDRLFVTQKTGLARILRDGTPLETPFLDLTQAVSTESEQGLLGLAFHPEYAENGRLFVNYTDLEGTTVIAEFAVSDDPNVVDAASEQILLTIPQPYANHNGGNIVFGPDGYLYIGMGDGGSGGDPEGNGQDLGAHLGKMLRIDVDNATGETAYGVPEDNPFVAQDGARPEIWAYGLRNPWRFSFDRETGDLWIADVGQNLFEEVNMQPADSAGGENYGWNITEASSCFNAEPDQETQALASCDTEGLTLPVTEYGRDEGQSITGGYVYRGESVPALDGHYVFGDFVSGTIWSAVPAANGNFTRSTLLESGFNVVAFGEDEAGELYVADFTGTLYRFVGGEQASN